MPNLTDVVLTKKAFICKEDFTVNSVPLFLRFTIRRRSPSKVLYLVLFLADNQRSSPQNSKAFIPTLKAVQNHSLTKKRSPSNSPTNTQFTIRVYANVLKKLLNGRLEGRHVGHRSNAPHQLLLRLLWNHRQRVDEGRQIRLEKNCKICKIDSV